MLLLFMKRSIIISTTSFHFISKYIFTELNDLHMTQCISQIPSFVMNFIVIQLILCDSKGILTIFETFFSNAMHFTDVVQGYLTMLNNFHNPIDFLLWG